MRNAPGVKYPHLHAATDLPPQTTTLSPPPWPGRPIRLRLPAEGAHCSRALRLRRPRRTGTWWRRARRRARRRAGSSRAGGQRDGQSYNVGTQRQQARSLQIRFPVPSFLKNCMIPSFNILSYTGTYGYICNIRDIYNICYIWYIMLYVAYWTYGTYHDIYNLCHILFIC
jgi:hypothetical protein